MDLKDTKLGEIAVVKGGKRLPLGSNLKKHTNHHPYIKVTNIVQNKIQGVDEYVPDDIFPLIQRYTVDENDLIISIVGTIGSVALVPKYLHKASLTENCVKVLTDNTKIDKKYLYYYLISRQGQHEIQSNTVGAVQAKLPIYGVQNITIPLPPLPEQRAIAAVLSSFDDKIELLRSQNQTLESLAQALFKEWFVDFNFPNAQDKPYKESGGKMVESELKVIPEGWRVGKLSEEFNILMGQSPPGDSYNEKGEGMIFFQGRAEFQERFPMTRLYTTKPKRIAEKYDVLVSVRAPVGDINVAFDQCCIGRGLAAVKSKQKSYALYKIKSLKESFDKFEAEGTVFGSINKDNFANIEVVIPPTILITRFEEIVNPIDQKILNNYFQIQTLSLLRNISLSKLLEGKITVQANSSK